MSAWNLDEELGEGQLEPMIRELYDAMFDDVIIGFLFEHSDKDFLVTSQMRWLRAHLGDRAGTWDGPSIRTIHRNLPILSGMFDRRHKLLSDVLEAWSVPSHVRDEWLELDRSLRPLVLNLGAAERERLLKK